MRVAVIGLLPDQARIIQDEFRGLDLRIAHKDTRESSAAAVATAAGADRVLVMQRFVGHSHIKTLDRRNLSFVNGGLSSLRKVLRNLEATAYAEPTPARQPASLDKPMTHHVNDFKLLATAKQGEVLTFRRPPQQTLKQWHRILKQMQTLYRNRYGVEVEVNITDAKAEMLITKAAGEKKPAPKPAAPTVVDGDPQVVLFWQQVYLQAQRNNPGGDALIHAMQANAAVDAMRQKFGAS